MKLNGWKRHVRGSAARSRKTYVKRQVDRILRFMGLSCGYIIKASGEPGSDEGEEAGEDSSGSGGDNNTQFTRVELRRLPVDIISGVCEADPELGEAILRKLQGHHLKKVKREIESEVMQAVRHHWNEVALKIYVHLGLTERAYQKLVHLLSKTWQNGQREQVSGFDRGRERERERQGGRAVGECLCLGERGESAEKGGGLQQHWPRGEGRACSG